MGRPSAPVLLSHTDRRWIVNEVLEASTLYAVLYRGSTVTLRRSSAITDGPTKRPQTVYPNRCGAEACARRLNALYRTDEFTVRELIPAAG